MKKVCFMAILAAMFFSCSSENDESPVRGTRNVVVQFAPATLSRATENPLAGGATATVSDYTIYFLDAAGNVVKGTKTGNTLTGGGTVSCTAVGETAISAYVIANITTSGSNISFADIKDDGTSNLNDIKEKVAEVSTQATIASVVLANTTDTGNGKIQATTDSGGKTTYAATVKVAPVVGRLEIAEIRGTGDITGFKLEGIYIDGHAVKFTVGGEYDKTINNEANHTKNGIYSIGVDNSLLTGYPTAFSDVAQVTATLSGSDYVAKPTASKVWAYQLAAGAPMPKIVVKLSAVNNNATDKYVTINSYKDQSNSNPYTTLAPGTIYKIASIAFETKNTAEVPNATEKDVTVTVQVAAWKVVNLEPGV